jgi:hypothetical protein
MRIPDQMYSPLVSALVRNPDRVPEILYVEGLLGHSHRVGYVRLYLPDGPPDSPFLDKWVDIAKKVIRYVLTLEPRPINPTGWNGVWIDMTAASKLDDPFVDYRGEHVATAEIIPSSTSVNDETGLGDGKRPAEPPPAARRGNPDDPEGGETPTAVDEKFPKPKPKPKWRGFPPH